MSFNGVIFYNIIKPNMFILVEIFTDMTQELDHLFQMSKSVRNEWDKVFSIYL